MLLTLTVLGWFYWLSALIVFQRIPKDDSSKRLGKMCWRVFVICFGILVVWILISIGKEKGLFPDTLSIPLSVFQIVLSMAASVLFFWHAFKGGALLFYLPISTPIRGSKGTEAFFEKQWKSWNQPRHRRIIKILFGLTIAFSVIPGLFALAMIFYYCF